MSNESLPLKWGNHLQGGVPGVLGSTLMQQYKVGENRSLYVLPYVGNKKQMYSIYPVPVGARVHNQSNVI
jgi:hypothetical protein